MKTLLLNIDKPKDDLLNGFKKEIRKNFRRGEEKLVLSIMNDEEYIKNLKTFRHRKGLTTNGLDRNILTNLKLFSANQNNQAVCGQGIYFKDNQIIEVALWRVEDCPYYASDWLKINCMIIGKNLLRTTYNFAGSQTAYKEKWGGVEYDDGKPEVKPHVLAPVRRIVIKTLYKSGIIS